MHFRGWRNGIRVQFMPNDFWDERVAALIWSSIVLSRFEGRNLGATQC